jgi:hypothetical protein
MIADAGLSVILTRESVAAVLERPAPALLPAVRGSATSRDAAVLRQHPSVREAVVLARADGPSAKRFMAYLVCFEGPRPTVGELAGFVKQKLPEVMMPAAFVVQGALPLTENGKVDRRALPAPEAGERLALGEACAAPGPWVPGMPLEVVPGEAYAPRWRRRRTPSARPP